MDHRGSQTYANPENPNSINRFSPVIGECALSPPFMTNSFVLGNKVVEIISHPHITVTSRGADWLTASPRFLFRSRNRLFKQLFSAHTTPNRQDGSAAGRIIRLWRRSLGIKLRIAKQCISCIIYWGTACPHIKTHSLARLE